MEYFFSVLSNAQLVAPQLFLCLAALITINARNISGYPLPYISVFLAYFTLGPVLNWAMNADLYVGTVESQIPSVAWWYTLCLWVWAIIYLLWLWIFPARHIPTRLATADNTGRTKNYWGLELLNLIASAWAALVIARTLAAGATDKLEAISQAGNFHYSYLLLEVVLSSAAILTWHGTGFSLATWINLATYTGYCLVTFERDFIFVFFALFIHIAASKSARFRLLIPMLGILAIIIATSIFVLRSPDQEFGISTVLGQGSNLFVDTFLLEGLTSGSFPPIESYWAAIFRQQPTEYGNLTNWLVYQWAGGADGSGYGFSLIGEAYMNGGRLAIVILFAVLAFVSLGLFRAADRSPLALMLSVAYTTAIMYAIRGELATLISTMLAALIIGVGASFASRESRKDVPPPGQQGCRAPQSAQGITSEPQ